VNDAVRQALAIDQSSSARDRTVDITTIGRQSGNPRRIEIWFHCVLGKYYLTGTPGKRDWYVNLVAPPPPHLEDWMTGSPLVEISFDNVGH